MHTCNHKRTKTSIRDVFGDDFLGEVFISTHILWHKRKLPKTPINTLKLYFITSPLQYTIAIEKMLTFVSLVHLVAVFHVAKAVLAALKNSLRYPDQYAWGLCT